MKRVSQPNRRSGVTLAELVLATGLAAFVMGALVVVMNSVLNLWSRGESVRQGRAAASAVAAMVAEDLRQIHGSSEGDLIADWEVFDVENDGTIERLWPRLRFIRDASARHVARIARRATAEAARRERDRQRAEAGANEIEFDERLSEAELLEAAGITREIAALGAVGPRDTQASQLLEVLWCIVPEGKGRDDRYSGVLYRAERVHRPGSPTVLMREDAFDGKGYPDLSTAREIAEGVLWFRPLFATQTTRIASQIRQPEGADADDPTRATATSGWSTRGDVGAAATSWDAWRAERPDPALTGWNDEPAGMPRRGERPLLPRRIRVELEIQRPIERRRAPRLVGSVDPQTTSIGVTNGSRLKAAEGRYAMIAGEWVRVRTVRGDRVTISRARRGTSARLLPDDAAVLVGSRTTLDIPIPMYEDDWRLEPETE